MKMEFYVTILLGFLKSYITEYKEIWPFFFKQNEQSMYKTGKNRMFSIHLKQHSDVWFHTKSLFHKFYLWQMKISDGLIPPMATSVPSHFLFEDY